MFELRRTQHGETRMRQRGFREGDLDLLMCAATQIADDAFLLTDQDALREIARRKDEIQRLERLRGSKVVVVGDELVTLYHSAQRNRPSLSWKLRELKR